MSLESAETENLFSYGSLQAEAVQLATFGRRLEGRPDSLVGYRIALIPIEDPNFVNINGDTHHRNLEFTGIASDLVEGAVFAVTGKEQTSGSYEPADWRGACSPEVGDSRLGLPVRIISMTSDRPSLDDALRFSSVRGNDQLLC